MAEETQEPRRSYRGPVRRLRLTIIDGSWQVSKQVRVDRMTLRRSVELPQQGSRRLGGAFAEVLDANGEVLHRQSIEDPTRPSVEVFDGERIFRVDSPEREMVVDVLVPDLDEVSSVRIIVDQRELPFKKGRSKPAPGGYEIERGDR